MKRLLENKIQKNFFSQLVDKFGDTAKSQKPDFLMTEEIANELFDFLNETIFENQIPKIHISVEKFDKNVHKNKAGQYFNVSITFTPYFSKPRLFNVSF